MKPNATVVQFFSPFSHAAAVETAAEMPDRRKFRSLDCPPPFSLVLDRSLDSGLWIRASYRKSPYFRGGKSVPRRPRGRRKKGRTRKRFPTTYVFSMYDLRALSSASQVLIEIKSGRIEPL